MSMSSAFSRGVCGLLLAGLVLVSSPAGAGADVRYTTRMIPRIGGERQPPGGVKMESTTYVKGQRQRIETMMEMGPMKMSHVTITQCDEHRTLMVDPESKIYSVTRMSMMPGGVDAAGGMRRPPPRPSQPSTKGTGKVVVEYSVKALPNEKVANLDTSHAMVTMHMTESGCAGSDDRTLRMEMWTTSIPAFNCDLGNAKPDKPEEARECEITYEFKGDVGKMATLRGGMPARIRIYDGDREVMTQELVDYSTEKLDDALFAPGADYRRVSEEEFQQVQQARMMRHIPRHGPPPGTDPGPSEE